MRKKGSAEETVSDIARRTRRKFSSEEKIRVVIEGVRGESSVAELCRREGIVSNLYYRWSKDFLEDDKKRLAGDTVREANGAEVTDLKRENSRLKELVAETVLESVGGAIVAASSFLPVPSLADFRHFGSVGRREGTGADVGGENDPRVAGAEAFECRRANGTRTTRAESPEKPGITVATKRNRELAGR